MTIRVSVVVPTCRRPELLARCLAALLAQDFDPAAYEIIVVDDAACAETRQLVEHWTGGRSSAAARGELDPALVIAGSSEAERSVFGQQDGSAAVGNPYAGQPLSANRTPGACGRGVPAAHVARPRVRYIPMTGAHGPAAARNAGWRAARGQIIAFTDDDCQPAVGWLGAGVAAFADDVVALDGQVVVPVPHPATDYERNAAGLAAGEFVTANCFCRRDVLDAVGGFDERFTAAWREDSDLFFTLLERCRRVERAPQAIVTHPIRPGAWGISLRQQRKSMFNALLYKKHPALYRQRIQPGPPWHYYRIVGTLIAALAGLAGGRWWLASGGMGAWALLTARFCARRLRDTSRAPGHVCEMVVTSALIPPLAVFWRLRGAIKFRVFFL
jgi:glycosyltransferase involved in cell wall biosynthesis